MADLVATLAQSRNQRICEFIDRSLAGSGLTFALVLFRPGQAGDEQSVSISAHPDFRMEAPLAVRTAALAFENMLRDTGAPPWTAWPGGECPCPDVVVVEFLRRDGRKVTSRPGRIDWAHRAEGPDASDVMGYRVLDPSQ